MGKRPTQVTRLQADQVKEIARVRALREEVDDLRRRISVGSYNDDELKRFWKLAETVDLDLFLSNSELAERAGLGSSFFSTMVRNKRRPRLQNFLLALNVLFDVANERLADVEETTTDVPTKIGQRIKEDR